MKKNTFEKNKEKSRLKRKNRILVYSLVFLILLFGSFVITFFINSSSDVIESYSNSSVVDTTAVVVDTTAVVQE
jgi:membrane protein involved in colicin uptake